jgi:peptide/nickel transport system ATP-binding protein
MEAEGEIDRGIELTRMKGEQMRKLRKEMQIVLQDPYSSLNPRMTVEEIIAEGIIAHGIMKQGSSELSDHIRATLELSGMPSSMLSRYPHEFSGGQRQRISIARALALSPKLIVCDECVSALDVSVGAQIINLLQDLKEREGLTYLFISHDLSVVRYISDRVGVMYLGRIVELGRAEEIFDHPRHPYTEALLSAAPGIGKRRILLGNTNASVSPTEAHKGCPYATRCRMATDRCRIERPLLRDLGDGHLCACHHAL